MLKVLAFDIGVMHDFYLFLYFVFKKVTLKQIKFHLTVSSNLLKLENKNQ